MNVAIFGIKFKLLMRTLRKDKFIDIMKWVIVTLTPMDSLGVSFER